MDMSAPSGASINDSIGESVSSLSYVGIDDAVKGIHSFGKGALLAKIEIYQSTPMIGGCWVCAGTERCL